MGLWFKYSTIPKQMAAGTFTHNTLCAKTVDKGLWHLLLVWWPRGNYWGEGKSIGQKKLAKKSQEWGKELLFLFLKFFFADFFFRLFRLSLASTNPLTAPWSLRMTLCASQDTSMGNLGFINFSDVSCLFGLVQSCGLLVLL